MADSGGYTAQEQDSQPGYRGCSALDYRNYLDRARDSQMVARQVAAATAAPGYIANRSMVVETVAPAMAAVRRFSRKSLYAVKLRTIIWPQWD